MKYADEFRKYDTDKVMYSLIDPMFLKEFAEVLTHGAKKYGIDNWKLLDLETEDGTRRYVDALLRHIEAYRSGEEIDPETNLSHLAHACCNLMFLHWFDARNKEEDKPSSMLQIAKSADRHIKGKSLRLSIEPEELEELKKSLEEIDSTLK